MMQLSGISKSRIFLIGVGAIVSIAIIAGAVYAFMAGGKPETVASDVPKGQSDIRSESAELVTKEQLEKDVQDIQAAVQQEKLEYAESKSAVNDEQKRIRIIN